MSTERPVEAKKPFDFSKYLVKEDCTPQEIKDAGSSAESSFITKFSSILFFLYPKVNAFKTATRTGMVMPPAIAKIVIPLGFTFAAKDIWNTFSMYKEAGFDKMTVMSQVAARTSYQFFNNFVIPTVVYGIVTKIAGANIATRIYRNRIAFLASVSTALLTSSSVEASTEKYFLNWRLARKGYFADSHGRHEALRQLYMPFRTESAISKSEEYLPTFPIMMMAEAAPSFEREPALGVIPMYNRTTAKYMKTTGDVTNFPASITGVPVVDATVRNGAFKEYKLAPKSVLAFDAALGFDLPQTLSHKNQNKMVAQVDYIYKKVNQK